MAVPFAGIDMEARLALLEFLLTNTDLQVSARRTIDWLAAHSDVQQAVVAVSTPGSGPLLLVAEHGISSSAIVEFALNREDEGHPLVRAMERTEPTYFDDSSITFRSPVESARIHAIPLRSDDESGPLGLLLVDASGPQLNPEVSWAA